ncbi:MAG: hydroxyacid dehydrogenase [Treponema sp.]|nr:hydroxyacid dehydrogenase [Treponema sp.]
MKKFVMTQPVCPQALALLQGKADIFVANDGDPNNYPDRIKDADAIIVRIGKLDRGAIEKAHNLKVIGRTGVGYDTIDLEAANERGIPIVITPGANSLSVAEHTIALMLAAAKNLIESDTETRTGNFSSVRSNGKMFEVHGKKAGIIGLGAIGIETARLCKALGMDVLGYDPYLPKEKAEDRGITYYSDYESMLGDCDFVSLHVPLFDTTKNMIAKKQFGMMKKTAVLINCARAEIVNEADLIEALESETIAGAAIDVFENEPPPQDSPILRAKNLLCTPHSAAQTREAVIRMHTICVEGCLAILRGEQILNVANKDVYQHTRN